MKLSILFILLFPAIANAWWPSKCESSLMSLFHKLEKKGALESPSKIHPDENYIDDGRPLSCLVKTEQPYNWFIDMHKNGVTILIHRYEFKTMESVYFGPFQSAYNK